jgi:peptidoglycan/xylan/chitin deacetylase (PgdA/CDA1 family)
MEGEHRLSVNFISKSLNRYYHWRQQKFPSVVWFGAETRREIALTFDDGPHPGDTPGVLDTLSRHDVRATFFLIGKFVEHYPKLVQRIHESGHQIGIHCYRHVPFPLEKSDTLQAQLDRTRHRIADICNILPETIKAVRPPYGAFTRKTLMLLAECGYQPVMWNCIPAHWMQPLPWSIGQVFDEVIPGSIIVLHDGHGHGSKVAQILDVILPALKEQEYRFTTVDKLQR